MSGFSTLFHELQENKLSDHQSKPLVISSRVCLARVPLVGRSSCAIGVDRICILFLRVHALKSSPAIHKLLCQPEQTCIVPIRPPTRIGSEQLQIMLLLYFAAFTLQEYTKFGRQPQFCWTIKTTSINI